MRERDLAAGLPWTGKSLEFHGRDFIFRDEVWKMSTKCLEFAQEGREFT